MADCPGICSVALTCASRDPERMRRRRKARDVVRDERELSSATKEIPPELRGRRVMTRLYVMADELRTTGHEPTRVHLSSDDEALLRASAEQTFGAAGLVAVHAGTAVWRAFLHEWFRLTVGFVLVLDASDTRVT